MPGLFKFSKPGSKAPATKTPETPPKRTPTESSYVSQSSTCFVRSSSLTRAEYDCHGVMNHNRDPSGRTWHYARDVRAQVQAERPPVPRGKNGYPSYYGNLDNQVPNLTVTKPYTHVPVTPGQSRPYKRSGWLGAHRAVYNDNDRTKVDVIYHDPKRPIPPGSDQHPFTRADYVPKASKPVATQQPVAR